jgi:hypothetical protein
MKTVWIFGDSFSTPFHCKTLGAWDTNYCNWKGYVPEYFGDIITNELGVQSKHFGIGGVDNDTIFEMILKQAPNICKGDIVIIGWSSIHRFRLADSTKGFITIRQIDELKKNIPFISKNTLEEILVNRSLFGYEYELYNRVKFLNWLFKDMILIQWTPFRHMGIKIWGDSEFSTITNETNGSIKDAHYSELGHKQLANMFLEMIGNDTLRKTINSTCDIDRLI